MMPPMSKHKKIRNELPPALTRRLAKLIDVRKIRRPGESAPAAFARRLRGKTNGQIIQMLYELESGEPGDDMNTLRLPVGLAWRSRRGQLARRRSFGTWRME